MPNGIKLAIGGEVPKEMIESLMAMGAVPVKDKGNDVVTFSTSTEDQYIYKMEKILWQSRHLYPFSDTLVIYAPHSVPGFKGWYFLLVRNPSPELIHTIQPSVEGEYRYPQFKNYSPKEVYDIIKKMREEKVDIIDMTAKLDIHVLDVISWSFYEEMEKSMIEAEKKLKEKFKDVFKEFRTE